MVEPKDQIVWDVDDIVGLGSLNCPPLDSFSKEKYLFYSKELKALPPARVSCFPLDRAGFLTAPRPFTAQPLGFPEEPQSVGSTTHKSGGEVHFPQEGDLDSQRDL